MHKANGKTGNQRCGTYLEDSVGTGGLGVSVGRMLGAILVAVC